MPALICAWREGIWPWPACSTWPITTCSTCSGSTSARSSAASIAVPPSVVASSVDSPPPILPMGVRAEPRITVLGMGCRFSWSRGKRREIENASGAKTARSAGGEDRRRRWRTSCTPSNDRAHGPERPRRRISCPDRAGIEHYTTRSRHRCGHVAVGLFEGEEPPAGTPAELGELLSSGEARRSLKALGLTHAQGKRWLTVGLGKREQFTPERAQDGRGSGPRTRARARHALPLHPDAGRDRRGDRRGLHRGHDPERLPLRPAQVAPRRTTDRDGERNRRPQAPGGV